MMMPECLKSVIRKIILSSIRDSLDVYNNIAHIQTLHQKTFGEFYNCNYGKDVVIVASGPTVKYYSPIKDVVHIGVNTVSKLKEKIPFEYMFMMDYGHGNPDAGREMLNGILNMDCIKFIGRFISDSHDLTEIDTPEGLIANTDARQFFVHPTANIKTIQALRVYPDIRYHNLIDFGTVVHPALHFALFTNPRRIYLVGCDTSSFGHFDASDASKDSTFNEKYLKRLKAGYIRIKEFAKMHYPDTEIISINPVGLKGVFTDEYTAEYKADMEMQHR